MYRPDTMEWVKKMGADHVINHRESLKDQVKALNLNPDTSLPLMGQKDISLLLLNLLNLTVILP